MQFQPFYKKVKDFRPLFTLDDLKTLFLEEKIAPKQLTRWQEQGYLIKLKNGVYILEDFKKNIHPFLIANVLYFPSYISLESALYEYGFIPDVPQTTTSVTTKKTWANTNQCGQFTFKKIKTDCFVGYGPTVYQGYSVMMAEPEKALADFCYLNKSRLRKKEQILQLRLNSFSLQEKINKDKFRHYGLLFQSPLLNKLIKELVSQF